MYTPKIDCCVSYDSVYTMDVPDPEKGGELEDMLDVRDTLVFQRTQDDGHVGVGITDEAGDTMVVSLKLDGDELAGNWLKWNNSGSVTASGVLSFTVDTPAIDEPYQGALIGSWDNGAGTWSLMPKIHNPATE